MRKSDGSWTSRSSDESIGFLNASRMWSRDTGRSGDGASCAGEAVAPDGDGVGGCATAGGATRMAATSRETSLISIRRTASIFSFARQLDPAACVMPELPDVVVYVEAL